MVEAGRVTVEEAQRVRSAADSEELDHAVRAIRLRHARARFEAEVRDGGMSADEAQVILQRLEDGEHPRLLRGLRRRVSPPHPEPGSADTHR